MSRRECGFFFYMRRGFSGMVLRKWCSETRVEINVQERQFY